VRPSLATRIAAFVEGLDTRALTDEVLHHLKPAALDCLACILGGRSERVSLIALAQVTRRGGEGPATIIGHRPRRSLEDAALVNGTMGHACDYDDVSLTMWGHATAPVLPAALAVAEAGNASGRDFLLAFLAGLEVEIKLGAAAAPVHYDAGWHPTATLGIFGAAVAGAKALGLDRTGIATALGIAASCAAGLRENFGTMTKPLHVGFAARNGLECALLAASSVTAAASALDGTYGFLNVLARGHGPTDELSERLGRPFDVVEPGLAYKMYPSCSDTHPSVDAVLDLRARHRLPPADIRLVRAGVMPMVASNLVHHNPKTVLESKFSLEFCVATALARGRLSLAEFSPGILEDGEIRALMARVEMWEDPQLRTGAEASFCWPASIEIRTVGGQTFRAVEAVGRGHPDKPASIHDLEQKFRECAAPVLAPEAVGRVLELVSRLEEVPRVCDLTRELTPVAEPRAVGKES
jgi:2-methylcitrate dehydratase PrpD